MKTKLPIWLCLVISLALVIFGLVFGTVRGFHDEKAQVTACLESENGLLDVLGYRGACNATNQTRNWVLTIR